MAKSDEKACKYCKETIKADAILCKHCKSVLEAERPAHGGVCPLCKETIKKDAVKCKHCLSDLSGSSSNHGCNCNGPAQRSNLGTASARLGLKDDAYKWVCIDGVMWCADANGVFSQCGSCLGGFIDTFPVQGRFDFASR